MSGVKWNILQLEDNDDDAFIVERAFKSAGASAQLHRCKDGKAAMDYFEGVGRYQDRELYPLPHLLLLDLKLPLRSGLDVIRWLRRQPEFKSQIIIVLTASAESRNVEEALGLNVNAYMVKPSSLAKMIEVARAIQVCWLEQFEAVFPVHSLASAL
jgi:CheY-like chemotaxis protein